MKLLVQGGKDIDLSKKDFLSSGGEGDVYVKGADAVSEEKKFAILDVILSSVFDIQNAYNEMKNRIKIDGDNSYLLMLTELTYKNYKREGRIMKEQS